MVFDATVNLGQIMTLFSMLGGGMAVILTLRSDMEALGKRVESLEHAVERQTEILVQINRQEVRLDSQERRLARLEDTKPA